MNQNSRSRSFSGWFILAIVELIAIIAVGLVFYYQQQDDALVVYCAHDAVFSQEIIREFEQKTGIKVEPRFDTEATKSLGLTNLIIREQDHPRCDVFWNNQTLGTAALKEQGLLEVYQGAGYSRIPEQFKDPDGYWTGFAARLRVNITNTEELSASKESIEQTLSGDLDEVAIAKPLYGTTLTHYTVLCDAWGLDQLKKWHHSLHKRGIKEASGNASVKNLVASGACDLGFTDTDDYFVAVDENRPVAALPVTVNDHVILIPNSVAIIKGTKRRKQAELFADYLLSEEVEIKLARSQSRQIPLGPTDGQQVPEVVREYQILIERAYPLSNLVKQREETLAWLKSEYVK